MVSFEFAPLHVVPLTHSDLVVEVVAPTEAALANKRYCANHRNNVRKKVRD